MPAANTTLWPLGFFADAGSFHRALQLDQNVPMTGACLPSLMPPLAAAGADVAALTACAGVLGGGGIASAPMPGAPVRYSPACAALPLAPSFSPAWLSRATAGCLARGACDAPCLRRVRDFLRAFARAGCVDEYFVAQRSTAAKQQAGPATGATSSSNAAAAAAARLALEERAVAALLPVVAAGADDLACARNAAGDVCLSFTDALPAQPSASASPSLGAALLAPAAAPAAASGAGAMDANPATRCAAWAQMGCCAPLVASLGLRAASALTAAVGYADAVAPAPAGAPPPGAAADAAAARALIGQLNAQCGRALGAAAPNISVAPCGAADAYLDAARYDPPATVCVSRAVIHVHARPPLTCRIRRRWYRARDGHKQLSGAGVAAVVFVVLIVAGLCGARGPSTLLLAECMPDLMRAQRAAPTAWATARRSASARCSCKSLPAAAELWRGERRVA